MPFLQWRPGEWPLLDHPDITAADRWLFAHDVDQGHLVNALHLRLRTGPDDDQLTCRWQHGRRHAPRFDAPGQRPVLDVPGRRSRQPSRTWTADWSQRWGSGSSPSGGRVLRRVALDLVRLRAEHEERSQWLRHWLDVRSATDWAQVHRGAAVLMAAQR